MTTSTSTFKSTSSGCGCGRCGSGTCTCQGTADELCGTCSDDAFSRPRFFAGQLLTDEDLQAMMHYFLQKRRLTNRHMFGAGVVCGLAVKRHPCSRRKVVVDPGHALDCCGNDIVVSCPQELDILEMWRELRVKLKHGYDCGDPCSSTEQDKPEKDGESAVDVKRTPSGNEFELSIDITQFNKHIEPHFGLYIYYCESEAEPVAPYATDDRCSGASCQASRVREGFRFELRCLPPHKDDDVSDPCAGLVKQLRQHTSSENFQTELNYFVVNAHDTLMFAASFAEKDQLEADFVPEIGSNVTRLRESKAAFAATASKENASEFLGAVNQAHSLLSKFRLAKSEEMTMPAGVDARVETLKKSLDDLWNETKDALLDFDERSIALEAQRTNWAAEYINRNEPADINNFADLSLASGQRSSPEELKRVIAQLDAFRKELQHIEQHRAFTIEGWIEPTLATINRLPLTNSGSWTQQTAQQVERAAATLMLIAEQLEKECRCLHKLPPCPDCEDSGVLLACLAIENCEIVKICNHCREYALSASSLRHWGMWPPDLYNKMRSECCGDLREQQPKYYMIANPNQPAEAASLGPSLMGTIPNEGLIGRLRTVTLAGFDRLVAMDSIRLIDDSTRNAVAKTLGLPMADSNLAILRANQPDLTISADFEIDRPPSVTSEGRTTVPAPPAPTPAESPTTKKAVKKTIKKKTAKKKPPKKKAAKKKGT